MYKVVKDFEREIAKYCGSKYAVSVTSCTMALLLCCEYLNIKNVSISIPHKTYVSVPQIIIRANGRVLFDKRRWKGMYQLKPYPIWDSARLLTSGMYKRGQFICLSLHWGKTLNLGQGGVILCDDKKAYEWFKKARFDARTEGKNPKDDEITFIGHHCYMSPRDASDALTRLHFLPKHNKPLPNDDYPDLSNFKIFGGK
jgi:dTDP-4-amino-4,6-dideoxygalactose transaminase